MSVVHKGCLVNHVQQYKQSTVSNIPQHHSPSGPCGECSAHADTAGEGGGGGEAMAQHQQLVLWPGHLSLLLGRETISHLQGKCNLHQPLHNLCFR